MNKFVGKELTKHLAQQIQTTTSDKKKGDRKEGNEK